MDHYVMVGEGIYPVAVIEKCHRDHLKVKSWMSGVLLNIEVPEPVVYDLEEDDEYDHAPNIYTLSKGSPIPFMRNDLYEVLCSVGVDNLQVYDAVIRDLKRGVDHDGYKAFNLVGKVAAADMGASTMMGTSDSTLIDADFDRLVIDENRCQDLLMFRLAENITAIVVAEVVKQEVEKHGIEGLFFYPNGEWAG